MSNNLGSLAGNLIAQRSLEMLHEHYPALSLVATDFTDEQADYNQTVISRIVTVGTASDYSSVSGFVPSNLATTDVSVTLNKFKHSSFELLPTEYSATKRNLIEDYATKVATEIGDAIYADLAALFITGNYANKTVQTVSGASRNNVIVAANTALNKRKVNKSRFAIYNSDLYGQLWTDESMVKQPWGGQGISGTQLPEVHGVTLTEYTALPTTASLIGVQGAKDSLVVATRVPTDISKIAAGVPRVSNVENVLHPDLGITLQVRSFENPTKGSIQYVATLMYGVAVGNSNSLQLITSA